MLHAVRIWYSDDDELDACVMHMERVHVRDADSLQRWSEVMAEASDAWLAKREGRPWFCLIDLAGFRLSPDMADDYGRRAKGFVARYFDGAIRFGTPDGLCTDSALRLGAIKGRFPSNLFRDIEAARVAYGQMATE